MMILTVHNLAKTYKLLPSEVLGRASTFDLYVLDTFHRYSKYQEDKAESLKALSAPPVKRMPTESEMLEMIRKAREE